MPNKRKKPTPVLLGLLAAGLLQWAGTPAAAADTALGADGPAAGEVITSTAPAGGAVRNPFAEAIPRRNGTEQPGTVEEIVFDGSPRQLPAAMGSLRGRTLPRVKVRGIMEVGGKVIACAEVENVGTVVLRANERVLLINQGTGARSADASSWFLVRAIDKTGMTIELDDGTLVQGKFL